MRLVIRPATILALSLASCAPAAPDRDGEPAPAPRSDALDDCAALGPGSLTLTGVEAEADFDAALLAVDVEALPRQLSLSRLSAFQQLLVRYMLDVPESIDTIDTRAAVDAGPLSWAAMAAFSPDGASVDTAFLRRGLHRLYGCARGFPPTLAEFQALVFDYRAEPAAQVVQSTVKNLPRRIWRSAERGAFVAETLLGDVVHETEIILTDRRRDGRIDFLEYNQGGILVGASTFAAATGGQAVGAVPFACISCHGTNSVTPPPP